MKNLCRRHCTIATIGFALNVCSLISSTVTIIFFGIQLSALKDYNYIYDYKDSECRIASGKAREIVCDESEIPLKWIAVFSTQRGSDVVENPFAVRDYRSTALQDLNRLVLNSTYPCVCRSRVSFNESMNVPTRYGCAVWTTCILSTDFIKYIQRDNQRYYHTYISFMITSFISILLTVAYLPIAIRSLRDIKKQEEYVAL